MASVRRRNLAHIQIKIIFLILACAVLVTLSGCVGASTSLEEAQRQVPFQIRLPASSALPRTVETTPTIIVRKEQIPGSDRASPVRQYLYSVEIYYAYRKGQAPNDLAAHSPAISIIEYQNPGGETELIGIPADGRTTEIDGRRFVVSRNPNVLGTEIVWIQDRTRFDLGTTLTWDDTQTILRSMTEEPSGDGKVVPPTGDKTPTTVIKL